MKNPKRVAYLVVQVVLLGLGVKVLLLLGRVLACLRLSFPGFWFMEFRAEELRILGFHRFK